MAALTRRPFLLFAVLNAVLGALGAALWQVLPEVLRRAVNALTGGAGLGAFDPSAFGRDMPMAVQPAGELWAVATVAMSVAGSLALPVAWLYTITRAKRGYRQSVVHTLVLLPVIVAGVVVLVKHSLALAFSLAGIVAAVRFRNTLEDSKDAVFIFVATGIGLAAGVELSVAATLSVLFNLATLLLFGWDFGRTPARLEGEMAEERMRRALEIANRTSQFVARLDEEVLEDMAPEQLEALADRAWKRRKEVVNGEQTGEDRPRFDGTLTVRTDGNHRIRELVEMSLGRYAKRWRFVRADVDPAGSQLLLYEVRLRKSVPPTTFIDALRTEGAAGILDVELR
jgi:hypothetical protein